MARRTALMAEQRSAEAAAESKQLQAHNDAWNIPEIPDAPPAPPPVNVVDVCSRFAQKLPPNYVVYAGGGHKGQALGYAAEPSGHEMTAFDVYVDEPHQDIVLVLGAYDPTIWNIRQTRATRIVGVIVSGYHQGIVNGLSADTPVLNTAYDNKAPCGHFYFTPDHPDAAEAVVGKVLPRPINSVFIPNNGRISMGNGSSRDTEYIQENPTAVDSLRPPKARLFGEAGLDSLMRDGLLRQATPAELNAWIQRHRAWRTERLPRLSSAMSGSREFQAYMVLKPTDLPTRLRGLKVFLIPSGLPAPQADRNVTVLTNDPPQCSGMLCD